MSKYLWPHAHPASGFTIALKLERNILLSIASMALIQTHQQ